ncbi:MAG: hydrogenase expression/formation protein HypE [Candidatus Omnitrophica bacterium]|nr:hydrogenase expression/formation protein HypE [Candidatus Omnitrophota bacterium]
MERITLSHGSGGKLMHELIKKLFVKRLGNPLLDQLGDAAVLKAGPGLAFTTDSFVVNPIFFPGGDIGKLSVCGTVNDLCVSGSRPRYLSCAVIVEEGFSYGDLEKIVSSVKLTCKKAGVDIITGDFKVVEKGAADKIFITTSGIGELCQGDPLSIGRVRPGDKVIINGTIGEHGAAVLLAREELKFRAKIYSDCAPLQDLVSSILGRGVKFMRDPTRGGLATTLNEIAADSGYNIGIEESMVPVKESVRVLCEALGMDPLYMANEGKVVVIAAPEHADRVLSIMRKCPLGKKSAIIGEVKKEQKRIVYLRTKVGGKRMLDMLSGEQFPRIC